MNTTTIFFSQNSQLKILFHQKLYSLKMKYYPKSNEENQNLKNFLSNFNNNNKKTSAMLKPI